MIEATVAEMYREDPTNQFLEVTYQNGDKQILYFKDFSSGAMIENVVRRAKKLAIKRQLAGGKRGIRTEDLIASIHQEYKEHEDLPNTTNPDDWAKISGKRASASSTSARSCTKTTTLRSAAGPSSASAPGSTSSASSKRAHENLWRFRRHWASRPNSVSGIAAPTSPITSPRRRCSSMPISTSSRRSGGPKPKVGWDFEDEIAGQRRPRVYATRRVAARGRDPPRQRRAHQRRPLLRRPRAS